MLEEVFDTKSLVKLDTLLVSEKNEYYWAVIALYINTCKLDLFKKKKYQLLNIKKIVEEYNDNYLIDDKNIYNKVYQTYLWNIKKKDFFKEQKIDYKKTISKILDEYNISINYVSTEVGVKQSNLYNFVIKEQMNKLSIESLSKIEQFLIKEVINGK